MKYERKLGELTEKDLDTFRSLQHCLNAAKLLIRESEKLEDEGDIQHETAIAFIRSTLYELEDRKKLELSIWDKIGQKYNLTKEEFERLDIDTDTGEIYILTKEYAEKRTKMSRLDMIWEG